MPNLLYHSPIGPLTLYILEDHLIKIDLLTNGHVNKIQNKKMDRFIQRICMQLDNYFKNPHALFTLPLTLSGTPFQQRVWQALRQIPVGTTCSYKVLAKKLKTSPRAIGNACRANSFPIIIPCHRVVAQHGIGGFAGKTAGKLIFIKKWLLQHESQST